MFINDIDDDNKWKEFLNYKINSDFVTKKDKKILNDFITNKKYKKITKNIKNNTYVFSTPTKHIISKNGVSKKRIVYSFNKDEMIILKYITYLLYEYDYLFEDNLYSFRKHKSVKNAINNISNIYNIHKMYGYKVDIQNYFNSINTDILLNNLKKDIQDKALLNLISTLITNNNVIYNNTNLAEEKGAMAGVPISSFLANYYIKEIDKYFKKQKLVYLRYADDIIIFTNTKEEITKYSKILKDLLENYQLTINKDKECFFAPNDKWEFLGFSFYNNSVDLSNNTIYKIKAKIRRSSRSIRRWMIKKDKNYEEALKIMIKKYNKKFYGNGSNELSWKYWFFPAITTSKSLKIIDQYLQDNLRYIVTGKHNKKNYKIVPYDKLKKFSYKSLVHEYYLFINMEGNV